MKNFIWTEHMNNEEELAILKVCKGFLDISFEPGDKLTSTSKIKHKIKTIDEILVHTSRTGIHSYTNPRVKYN